MVITKLLDKLNYSLIEAQPTVLINEDQTFCGLFFQDQSMIDIFKAYPEIVFVDATYKLLDLYVFQYF